MRKIKFKGKRLDNGEWVTGDLAHSLDGALNILGFGTQDSVDGFSGVYHIDSETVCQFTGFLDKNGKEIYEGDVLRGKRVLLSGILEETYDAHFFIKFDKEMASFLIHDFFLSIGDFKGMVNDYGRTFTRRDMNYYEVIGSIHDKEWQEKLNLKNEL